LLFSAVAVFGASKALAESCTVQNTTTNSKFQMQCDADVSRLAPAQWSRHCKLPTAQQLVLVGQQPPSSARPCKDENDTGCYSLVTLECR
jgi:hypothetical protein